ncbi:hypothetical protein RHS01_10204 [Rhizoctonia solani]|uniref:Uncharacterized protein n=1 Tax=Rhizoctonia solani TaxID=456999 RepID=A0A8H7M0R0_9AGAM|nr:hypothetical protein RHS01_10204 [Rhizoctonia solani]
MSFSQDYYCYPIFTSYRNDVPLTPELGIIEASHVHDLYYVYANRHNDHYSPYSENHPDPLERRIHAMPDIEVFLMDDDHPLNAVQPVGWNCREPWANYDYATELVKIAFRTSRVPFVSKKTSITSLPIHSTSSSNNNIAHVGYIRAPPPAFWRIVFGAVCMVTRLSIAGFPVNGYDGDDEALGPITPPPENVRRPKSSEQPKTAYLGYQNGDSFTAPEYAPLHAANKAGEFPAPEYADGHELDIAALTQQLSLVAVAQSVESVSPGFGNDFVASVWEWPGEPNPVVDLGPPEWPTVPQQHTPRSRGKTTGTRFTLAT